MSLREELLAEHGTPMKAAAELARGLNRDNPAEHKVGYTRPNALRAAAEYFDVDEVFLREELGWGPPTVDEAYRKVDQAIAAAVTYGAFTAYADGVEELIRNRLVAIVDAARELGHEHLSKIVKGEVSP